MDRSSDYTEHKLKPTAGSRLSDDLELEAQSYTTAPGDRYTPARPGLTFPRDDFTRSDDEDEDEGHDANENTKFITVPSTDQESLRSPPKYQTLKHKVVPGSMPSTGPPKPANRYADFDTDNERIPADLVRTGYDADTEIYYYASRTTGLSYAGLPGNRYGEIHLENSPAWHAARAREAKLVADIDKTRWWWREEAMFFFPFFLIVGAIIYLVIAWPFGSSSHSVRTPPVYPHAQASCALDAGEKEHYVAAGDTCWSIAQEVGLNSWEELSNAGFYNGHNNLGDERIDLDCDHLMLNQHLCYPDYTYTAKSDGKE